MGTHKEENPEGSLQRELDFPQERNLDIARRIADGLVPMSDT